MAGSDSAKRKNISIDQAAALLDRQAKDNKTLPPGEDCDCAAQHDEDDKELMRRTQDVEILKRRLILQSPNGDLWSVTVSNSGILSATAL